jgi:hypothetical protein
MRGEQVFTKMLDDVGPSNIDLSADEKRLSTGRLLRTWSESYPQVNIQSCVGAESERHVGRSNTSNMLDRPTSVQHLAPSTTPVDTPRSTEGDNRP